MFKFHGVNGSSVWKNRAVAFLLVLSSRTTSSYGNTIGFNDEITYEAENVKSGYCTVEHTHPGFSGSGYLDFSRFDAWALWEIDIDKPGNYEVSVRYAAAEDRPARLRLDGIDAAALPFVTTKNWTTWMIETKELFLTEGHHKLNVTATDSSGPNVDWLSIQSKDSAQNGGGCMDPDKPSDKPSDQIEETLVLRPGAHLSKGEFVSSPTGKFQVGITDDFGDLVLKDAQMNVIWKAGVVNGDKCYMQDDGNLIIRDVQKVVQWTTHTSGNVGSHLVVDDGGRIAVKHGNTPLWIHGKPRGQYIGGPKSSNLEFPVRAMFYYPWYPQTWTVNGKISRFEPQLGFYSSSDETVVDEHIDSFEYAHCQLGIASWWGQGETLDRARVTLLMDRTVALKSDIKWTVYYEDEQWYDFTPAELKADLKYLRAWFAWHKAWAHVDNRPLIFVYNQDDCAEADRWMEASDGQWYVVLKVFNGFEECPNQPDGWHQYGPATAVIHMRGHSFTLSPGFWRADEMVARLARVGETAWRDGVRQMVDSNEDWQLITTFNEAGEGTMIESSRHWLSESGYGFYLDALNEIF